MLINVPKAGDMEEMALRLYFDAWERTVSLVSDFAGVYDLKLEEIDFDEEPCELCGSGLFVEAPDEYGTPCYSCGHS